MEYYPQSMGTGSKPLIPFLDSITTTSERVIFRPPVESVVLHGGSGYRKAVPLKPPIISTQIETGTFATNFHEIKRTGAMDEDRQLVVPPWIERRPTEDEVAVEREFWGKEKHWDDLYWEAVERKLEEAEVMSRKRQDMGGASKRRSSAVSLTKSTGSVREVQRADSYRRALKLNSPARSVGSSAGGSNGGGGYGRRSGASVSSNGSVKPSVDIRRGSGSAALRMVRPGKAHDDASSISSGTTKYHLDKCDTDSIHTAFSEEDVLHIKQGRGGAGSAAPTTLTPSRPGSVNNGSSNQRRLSPSTTSVSKAAPIPTKPKQLPKLSPRQRILVAQEAAAAQEASKQHVASDLTTATLTTPYTSRIFQVEEGFDPFDWGTPNVAITGWLWEVENPSGSMLPTSQGEMGSKGTLSEEGRHGTTGSDCGHTDDGTKKASPSERTDEPHTAPSTCKAVSPSTPTHHTATDAPTLTKDPSSEIDPVPTTNPTPGSDTPHKPPTNEPFKEPVPPVRPQAKEKGGCCIVM